jgi:hypothetical protein
VPTSIPSHILSWHVAPARGIPRLDDGNTLDPTFLVQRNGALRRSTEH